MVQSPASAATRLGFECDEGYKDHSCMALAAIPLLAQALLSLGAIVKRNMSVKLREHGYNEATYVESLGLERRRST